jgi:hypothetical protein
MPSPARGILYGLAWSLAIWAALLVALAAVI